MIQKGRKFFPAFFIFSGFPMLCFRFFVVIIAEMELETFKITVLPLREKLINISWRMIEDRSDAEDIVQETFLKLWQIREKLDGYNSVEALAVQVAKNLALDKLKQHRPEGTDIALLSLDSGTRNPAEELEQQTVDVYVERALHGPVFRMSYEHTHTYCEIFYLKSGTCTYTVNQGQWHLEAGDLFIVAAGDPHSTRYEGKTSCERIIVFCKSDVLAGMMRGDPTEVQQALERSCKVILNAETRTMVEALLDQMLLENDLPRKYSEQVLELESLHLVLLLLRNGIFSHETMSPKEGYSADIERALKYIALNYQQPLTLEEVAGYCNLSPTYFSRKFRLITGQTFKEHVNYIRLRQATQMLLMTDNSITKIAMLCGFGSSNYFKDLFRASTGRSPREYRKHSGLPIHPHLRDNG